VFMRATITPMAQATDITPNLHGLRRVTEREPRVCRFDSLDVRHGPERAAAPGISGRPARLLGLLSAQQQTDVLAVSRYVLRTDLLARPSITAEGSIHGVRTQYRMEPVGGHRCKPLPQSRAVARPFASARLLRTATR
jgi:hypothetical protein